MMARWLRVPLVREAIKIKPHLEGDHVRIRAERSLGVAGCAGGRVKLAARAHLSVEVSGGEDECPDNLWDELGGACIVAHEPMFAGLKCFHEFSQLGDHGAMVGE